MLSKSPAGTGVSPYKGVNQVHKTRSWYGSWPRKSAASTQVARETILGGTVKSKTTADFSRFGTKKDSDGTSVNDVAASAPELSLPGVNGNAEVTVGVTSDPVLDEAVGAPKSKSGELCGGQNKRDPDKVKPPEPSSQPETVSETVMEAAPKAAPSSSWLGGWFGRPMALAPTAPESTEVEPEEPMNPNENKLSEAEPTNAPPSGVTPSQAPVAPEPLQQALSTSDDQGQNTSQARSSGGYWFGFWSSNATTATTAAAEDVDANLNQDTASAPMVVVSEELGVKDSDDIPMQDAPPVDSVPAPAPKAGSTWAFWSRDTGSSSGKIVFKQESGQLAVIGESSESHPKRANSMEFKGSLSKEPPLNSAKKDEQAKPSPATVEDTPSKKSKRARPVSAGDDMVDTRLGIQKAESSSKAEQTSKAASSKTPTTAKTPPPNLLLPCFSNTYRQKENPSIIRQIAQLILRAQHAPPKHVFLSKEQPKIKRALAIGVHGLYPANYLRPMIGQPTGTSIKFANHCAEAIRRWADSHGCQDCEIEKVALEGEGKIGDRVENLWRLLLNWIDQIRKADFIILGCHSQGVPVSIMLLAKLIELGIITTAKVGVCAMGRFWERSPIDLTADEMCSWRLTWTVS